MKDINRVRNSKLSYERMLNRVEELEVLATKTTKALTGMPRGGNSKADDPWAVLADYRTKCGEVLIQYIKDCKELDAEIDSLKLRRRARQTKIALKCRYVDCMTDTQIASVLHYDERYIRQLIYDGRQCYEKTYRFEN